MSVVAFAAVAVVVLGGRGGAAPPHPQPAVDPVLAARRARDGAVASPLIATLVTGQGTPVARARIDRTRSELAAGGIQAVQEGERLHALGRAVDVAAPDPVSLLRPLVDRPARWEGRHLRLDGDPAARAWLDARGRLARLEIDLGGGSLLVVTPAG